MAGLAGLGVEKEPEANMNTVDFFDLNFEQSLVAEVTEERKRSWGWKAGVAP